MGVSQEHKARSLEVVRQLLIENPEASKSAMQRRVKSELGFTPGWDTLEKYLIAIAAEAEAAAKPEPVRSSRQMELPTRARREALTVVQVQRTEEAEVSELVRSLHRVMRATNITAVHITRDGGVRIVHAEEYTL